MQQKIVLGEEPLPKYKACCTQLPQTSRNFAAKVFLVCNHFSGTLIAANLQHTAPLCSFCVAFEV